MRRAWVFLWLFGSVRGAETWKEYKAGPVSVLAVGMDKEAADTLNLLDQYRYTLGQMVGVDLMAVWPVKIVLLKERQAAGFPKSKTVALRRDSYMAAFGQGGSVVSQLYPSFGRLLLEDGISGMPAEFEEALLALFSTLEVEGTRVTLGAPPAKELQTRLWARLHLLAVDPRFSGKLRVMLSNMRKGVEPDVAMRNAFELSAEAIEKEVNAYMAKPITGTTKLNGHAVEVRRSGLGRELDAPAGDIALVDPEPTEAGYQAIIAKFPNSSEANEGLGLLTKDQAILSKSQGARAQAALGTYEALRNAAGKNPRWGEPARMLAALESDTGRKLALMKKYTELTPRDWKYWGVYAQALQDAEKFPESSKAWLAAEKAAPDQRTRETLREGRRAANDMRADAEAEARRKELEDRRNELERLKNEAMARVREAEAKANKGLEPLDKSKVEQWWDGAQADASIIGKLERVDCLKGYIRFAVRGGDNKVLLLGAQDMTKVGLSGAQTLSCGAQKPVRAVAVDYAKKTNPARQTAGDVVRVELK